jgi:hypothetical protein
VPIPGRRSDLLNEMTLLCASAFYQLSEEAALEQQLSACGQRAPDEASKALQLAQTLDSAAHDEGPSKPYTQQYYNYPQASMRHSLFMPRKSTPTLVPNRGNLRHQQYNFR